METAIPSAAEIRVLLEPLRTAALRRLAEQSGVSFYTLMKIRSGETSNPGIESVRAFLPHIEAAQGAPASQPGALT